MFKHVRAVNMELRIENHRKQVQRSPNQNSEELKQIWGYQGTVAKNTKNARNLRTAEKQPEGSETSANNGCDTMYKM